MERLELPYCASALPYFQHLANEPGAIWFHSGQPLRPGHRWEWCSAWPTERYRYLGQGRVRVDRPLGTESVHCDDFFRFLAQQVRPGPGLNIPFSSGLAGHLDYELGYELHSLTGRHTPRAELACVGRYDWSLVTDHDTRRSWLLIHEDCPADIRDRALTLRGASTGVPPLEGLPRVRWQSLMSEATYQDRFERIREYILAGDIYQANLTRQWRATLPENVSDWALYRHLIERVPAPFSVYHKAADHTLLSVSPERFITIDQDRMTTQPIKGTRRRGKSEAEDRQLAEELSASEKDRAENLMIVDLLRNDLSRNAAIGSVKVPDLFKLETFSNVHHLVSTITARLKSGSTPLDALRDAFPGGSITGAPKRRAMEIIEELELAPRGSYCGSAFWLGDDGCFDSNILIRSLVRQHDRLVCSGGGGIVADSVGDEEYKESATKVRQLLEALGRIDD
ncbi:aminodeoxychorismate synthase component I [Saccharospirillum salsuginis]|uniref:aminodeoxychorismate synthase component I n=1 Tax=Saccharospirillum salsuginis TaxID=418750 RepID=UPI00167261F0|nr:aminodeoxychorismate synthase component I [Saccharospirillum salsuginis]